MAIKKGSNKNDILYGNEDENDILEGLAGNDHLIGYSGNDKLIGGEGNDFIDGGAGNDILNAGTGNDRLFDNGGGNDTYLFTVSQTDGQDKIEDRYGNDTVIFTNLASTAITQVNRLPWYDHGALELIYGNRGQLRVEGYFHAAEYRIEQFKFSDGVIWDWADLKRKALKSGTRGNDNINGYEDENDILEGFAGDDTLSGQGGDDKLNGGANNDILYGHGGNDQLNGGTGSDLLDGGYGNDTYLISSNDGQDWIRDNGGNDKILFTNLAPIAITQINRDNYDLLLIYGIGQQLTIEGYFSGIDSMIEEIQFNDGVSWNFSSIKARIPKIGTSGDDTLYGFDDENDTLNGLAGNDVLFGFDGNDNLHGGTGNDIIDGGNGVDIAQYWTATKGVKIDLSLTNPQDTLGAGVDTLLLIENLNGSIFNDTLLGNAFANTLLGNSGDDKINAGDGNDFLMGGAGHDILDGGNGDDMAHYGQAKAGVNIDLRLITAQNTQGDGVDTLTSIENVNGSGFSDKLTGNAVNNRLLGGAGNDTLNGHLGNDTLTGGPGQDVFIFNTPRGLNNVDTVTDFSVADDTIQLENSVFKALTNTGTLAGNTFKIIGSGNSIDTDDRILYNTVTGGLSYDTDGSGSAVSTLIAIIGKGLAVTAADFTVI